MLDVLLIYPPIYFDKNGNPKCLDVEYPPLGILYLASSAKEKGLNAGVCDVGAEELTLGLLKEKIKKDKPKIIGISSMTANLRGAIQTAELIRENFPEIIIGLGGSHFSADSEIINRFSHLFDFGVTGEAEITFPKIVKKILAGEPFEKITRGEIVENLDILPEPARDLVAHLPYKTGTMIFSSRGCPYNCIFCSRPAISSKIRYRSPILVVNEMENIYKQTGNVFFIFEDDTLTLDRTHILGICEEIIKRGLVFSWTAITRADRVDEEIIEKMKRAGCKEMTFGVESGSERIRNEVIGKNLSDKDIKKAFSLCKKYKIRANAFLMLGFPTENREDVLQTVNFYKGLSANIIGVHISLPLPGSRLWVKALEEKKIDFGIIDKYAKGELGEGFHENWPHYIPDGFSFDELEDYRKKAYTGFYFRPSYVLMRLIQDITSWGKLKFDVQTGISLLIKGNTYRQ